MVKRYMTHQDPFVRDLVRALGLPAGTSEFELRAAVDEIVTVKCTYSPTDDATAGFDPAPLTARYKLVEMGEAEPLAVMADDTPVVPQPLPFRRGPEGSPLGAVVVYVGVPALILVVMVAALLVAK